MTHDEKLFELARLKAAGKKLIDAAQTSLEKNWATMAVSDLILEERLTALDARLQWVEDILVKMLHSPVAPKKETIN